MCSNASDIICCAVPQNSSEWHCRIHKHSYTHCTQKQHWDPSSSSSRGSLKCDSPTAAELMMMAGQKPGVNQQIHPRYPKRCNGRANKILFVQEQLLIIVSLGSPCHYLPHRPVRLNTGRVLEHFDDFTSETIGKNEKEKSFLFYLNSKDSSLL